MDGAITYSVFLYQFSRAWVEWRVVQMRVVEETTTGPPIFFFNSFVGL